MLKTKKFIDSEKTAPTNPTQTTHLFGSYIILNVKRNKPNYIFFYHAVRITYSLKIELNQHHKHPNP